MKQKTKNIIKNKLPNLDLIQKNIITKEKKQQIKLKIKKNYKKLGNKKKMLQGNLKINYQRLIIKKKCFCEEKKQQVCLKTKKSYPTLVNKKKFNSEEKKARKRRNTIFHYLIRNKKTANARKKIQRRLNRLFYNMFSGKKHVREQLKMRFKKFYYKVLTEKRANHPKTELKIHLKTINHIMMNGKKTNSEKNFVESIKTLQKASGKQSKRLFQLAIRNTIPVFKMNKITSRKRKKRRKRVIERPAFIRKNSARASLALKFIIMTTRKKKDINFSNKLTQEIILAAQNRGDSIEHKKDLQKRVSAKKHVFKYYRW